MFWKNMSLPSPTEFYVNNEEELWLPVSQAARFSRLPCLTHPSLTGSLAPLWDLAIAKAGPWQCHCAWLFPCGLKESNSGHTYRAST